MVGRNVTPEIITKRAKMIRTLFFVRIDSIIENFVNKGKKK